MEMNIKLNANVDAKIPELTQEVNDIEAKKASLEHDRAQLVMRLAT